MISTLHEPVRLLAPTEGFRDEFLSLLNDLHQTGETLSKAELARTDFGAYIRHLHGPSQGRDLPAGYVPVSTFWLVKGNQIILGESQLRHSLTPALEAYWGHIGYLIRPSQRRKGYGRLILKLTLDKARELGIQRVRVTCDTDNIASTRIIERNDGTLSGYSIDPKDGKPTSQYWIEL